MKSAIDEIKKTFSETEPDSRFTPLRQLVVLGCAVFFLFFTFAPSAVSAAAPFVGDTHDCGTTTVPANGQSDSSSNLGEDSSGRDVGLDDATRCAVEDIGRSINSFFDSGIGLFLARIAVIAAVPIILFGFWKIVQGVISARGGGGGLGQAIKVGAPVILGGVVLIFLRSIVTLLAFIAIKLVGGGLSWLLDQV